MLIEVEHEFDAPVARVAEAMFHPGYYDYLAARHETLEALTEQSRHEDDSILLRRVHYKPKPAFEHIGPRRIPPEWFEFVEESSWDKVHYKLTFSNVPCTGKVARRLTNWGSIQLSELAPGKTVRRARAELRLSNLPLVLRPLRGMAEQMIAREARKLLETEARVLNEWLGELWS